MKIEVRSARAADADAMLTITSTVWGGDDYVPFVWERWLRDRNGVLLVATIDGAMVGLQHVELQPEGDAWLEGIRVAENARGRGIGEALVERGVVWARDMGCAAARLAVASENAASNRLSEKAGFNIVGRFRTIRGEASGTAASASARIAQLFEEQIVVDVLETVGHPYPAYYTEGWTAYRLTRERLRLLLATHAVLITGVAGHEAIAIATASDERVSMRLGLVAGPTEGIEVLGRWLRARAVEAGIDQVRGTLDAAPEAMEALDAAGFGRGDVDMLLRERRLR